ncbi:MAG: helix-turn-helix domain-containing protein [Armatimonadetes bacterium]|nr:helix-turn-helix domain-containing protein [Armatimonadota bacterium]
MDESRLVAMFRALGDPTRLSILSFLCSRSGEVALGEDGDVHPVVGATVGEVCCYVTGMEGTSSTISFHLKELKNAGLVTSIKQGKYLICRANPEAIEALGQQIDAWQGMLGSSDTACSPLTSQLIQLGQKRP